MLRRTPFRRKPQKHEPAHEREPRPMADRREIFSLLKPATLHTGVYSGSTSGPAPKEQILRSTTYENAVRSLGFCVRCGRVCRPQFCHRDQGKGIGTKTDPRQGWAGCDECHALLGGHKGGGRMPKEQRRAEEDQLAAITRHEVRARGLWPKSVAPWSEA